MSNPDKPSYTHGSTGTEPTSALDYNTDDPLDADNLDYYIHTTFNRIKAIIDQLEVIDSDGDGKVDAADTADSATTATNVKGNDIDSDGDGKVDSADSADTAAKVKGNDIDSDGDGTVDAADVANKLSGLTLSEVRAAVDDDGTEQESAVERLDFGDRISVTADGNGGVTITAADQADTRVDVADDGTQTVIDASEIDFADNISVTDDGDDSVTVTASDDAATYKGNDIDSDGDGKVDSADSADNASTVDGADGSTHAAESLPEFGTVSDGENNVSRGDLFVVEDNSTYDVYLND